MLNEQGIPLFAGVENIDDMFIATMDEYDKELGDEITIQHPLWVYLKQQKLIEYRDSIGNYVPVRLLDKPNSTVKDFSHYDDVDMTPQDALSEAHFAYGHIMGNQMYSREELVKNSGPEQLLDLVEVKREQLETSMQNHFGDRLMGTQDADGRTFMGLGRIMDYDVALGGIDPTKAGFGYWNPQRALKADGVTQFALATEFRTGFRKLVRQCTYRNNTPDVFVCGEDLYDEFQAWAEDKLRLSLSDLKETKGWGDFNMFPFHGRTIIYDEALDPKTGWLFNFKKYVRVRIHSGTNFQFEPWQMLDNKIAKTRNCLTYASVYVRRRNANGFIQFQ